MTYDLGMWKFVDNVIGQIHIVLYLHKYSMYVPVWI